MASGFHVLGAGRGAWRRRDAGTQETKPTSSRRQGRDALATNALRRRYERGLLRETKPIWGQVGGGGPEGAAVSNCAKQSQWQTGSKFEV